MRFVEIFLFGLLIGAAAGCVVSGIVLIRSKIPGRKGRGFRGTTKAAQNAADRKYMDKWKDVPAEYTSGRQEVSADWRSHEED